MQRPLRDGGSSLALANLAFYRFGLRLAVTSLYRWATTVFSLTFLTLTMALKSRLPQRYPR